MNMGVNQPLQPPGYVPTVNPYAQAQYQGHPTGFATDPGQSAANSQFVPLGQPASPLHGDPTGAMDSAGMQGVTALVGLTLRALDEISAIGGRALEQTPDVDARPALWQMRQLANQARSYAYQIRGMLLP
ncbi:MAG: hypothetical protein ACM3ZC_07645 [Bacteroidota bacterium]